jgi:hypothetical protein
MSTRQTIFSIIGILLVNAFIWFALLYWIKRKMKKINRIMRDQYCSEDKRCIIEPKSALYRGSDKRFGNVKGNGVICLTGNSLIFEKITGQRIEIKRSEIMEALVDNSFKGKTSFATGGRHLVIKTNDGNRVGFLLQDAEVWAEKIKKYSDLADTRKQK